MQFKSIIAVAALAGSAMSAALDSAPIVAALTKISTGINTLNTDVSGWNGDVVAASAVLTKATDLLAVIDQATKDTAAQPVLALTDAVKILAPGNKVIDDTKTVVATLSSKKAAFDKAELSPVVLDTLNKFRTGALSLIAAIKTKLPANVQSVGDSIGKQITAQLDTGITAYGGK